MQHAFSASKMGTSPSTRHVLVLTCYVRNMGIFNDNLNMSATARYNDAIVIGDGLPRSTFTSHT